MSKTDETARAIIATAEPHWGFCEAGIEFEHLQSMARLWLMWKEIQRRLHDFANATAYGTTFDPQASMDLLAKLEALEAE